MNYFKRWCIIVLACGSMVPAIAQWRNVRAGEETHVLLKKAVTDDTFKKIVEDLMVQLPKR